MIKVDQAALSCSATMHFVLVGGWWGRGGCSNECNPYTPCKKWLLYCSVYVAETVLLYQDSELAKNTQGPSLPEDSLATVANSSSNDTSWKDNLTNKTNSKLDSNAKHSKQTPPVAMETASHKEETSTSSHKRKWNFVYSNG